VAFSIISSHKLYVRWCSARPICNSWISYCWAWLLLHIAEVKRQHRHFSNFP